MLLRVNNLVAHYGGIIALNDVSIEIDEGEIVAVLGANGAGKTTLLKCICSAKKATSGEILFNENKMPSKTYNTVKKGLGHVPEGRQIFSDLTVYDNLMAGAYLRRSRADVEKDLKRVFELFPRLEERKNQFGGHLSGGEQQMLAISRGIMSRPRLLMMDEPSLGLAPIIVTQIFEIFHLIREQGTSILLVEQNAYKALECSDRAYVMNVGKIVRMGHSRELIKDQTLIASYLGE